MTATHPATSHAATDRPVPMEPSHLGGPSIRRLIAAEGRLFIREPVGLVFVIAFPALTALIIGGSFEADDPAFGGAAPSAYYLAAYLGVVLAAVGFVLLPGHLATYRERGVLRRFDASPFPAWALPVAWMAVATALTAVGVVSLFVTMQLAFGIPAMADPFGVAVAIAVSLFAFVNLGLWLGMVLPNSRAAQGVGLLLFFPSFLLGGAGPPPAVMPSAMRTVSNVIPTAHVVHALQHAWLGIGHPVAGDLIFLLVIGMVATAGWVHAVHRSGER